LLGPNESNRVRQTRVSNADTVALAQPSTGEHCEAGKHTGIEVRDEAQIMAIDIGGVLTLVGETDFELTRKIRVSIQRIFLIFETGCPFAIEPNLEVRAAARLELARKLQHITHEILPFG